MLERPHRVIAREVLEMTVVCFARTPSKAGVDGLTS